MSQALDFLRALWPEGPPTGQHLLLWSKQGDREKRSSWHTDLERMAEEAAELSADRDVYCGIGSGFVPRVKHTDRVRLKAGEVRCLPGHVADIDFGEIGHKKKRLFPGPEEALRFVEGLPLQPTLIVNSGGGYQAWWLYHEEWDIADERGYAQDILRGWHGYLRDQASPHDFDSVLDLSRVMRIPGTNNHKDGLVREVLLVSSDGPRYDPSDFETWIDTRVEVAPGLLELRPSQNLDAATERFSWWPKLQALCDVDPKFKSTWAYNTRQRPDLPSSSEFDFSMATKMWAAGWDEQEILDALVHWRRMHASRGLEPRVLSYYNRHTLPNAFASEWANQERAALQLHEEIQEASEEGKTAEVDLGRVREQVTTTLGIPVERIERDSESHTVVLANGRRFRVGTAEQLLEQKRWRSVAFTEQIALKKLKPGVWDRVLDLLALLVEDHTRPEITRSGQLLAWIAEEAEQIEDEWDGDGETLCEIHGGGDWFFRHEGGIVVFFQKLLARLQNQDVPFKISSPADLSERLRSLKASPWEKSVRLGKTVRKIRGFRLDLPAESE